MIPHADIIRRIDEHGQVWFRGEDAAELLLRGYDIAALLIEPTAEIARYNEWCGKFDKTAHRIEPDRSLIETASVDRWWIAEPFRDMDVRQAVLQRCVRDDERERVRLEMDLFEARGLIPVLRLMFMLVDHFRQHDIVWGVGRGSSVASYVLFLIGIHRIDALRYNLDIKEFLR